MDIAWTSYLVADKTAACFRQIAVSEPYEETIYKFMPKETNQSEMVYKSTSCYYPKNLVVMEARHLCKKICDGEFYC